MLVLLCEKYLSYLETSSSVLFKPQSLFSQLVCTGMSRAMIALVRD